MKDTLFVIANLVAAFLLLLSPKLLLKKGDERASAKRLRIIGLVYLAIAILELLFSFTKNK